MTIDTAQEEENEAMIAAAAAAAENNGEGQEGNEHGKYDSRTIEYFCESMLC